MDEKKPNWEEIAQQPWVQAAKGLLQFVGGGLMALRHDTMNGADREILDTLADLGFESDPAGAARRSWEAARGASPQGSQPPAEEHMPSMSFDEFVQGMAEFGIVPPADAPKPQPHPASPDTPGVPSDAAARGTETEPPQPEQGASRLPRTLEELVRTAPPARSSTSAPQATPTPSAGPGGPACTQDERDRRFDERIGRLEERLRALTEVLTTSGLGQAAAVEEELSGHAEAVLPTVLAPLGPTTESAVDREPEGVEDDQGRTKPADDSTVVQGPWFKSHPEVVPGSNSPSSIGPSASDVREQRMDQLEHTLGTFGKMVEGFVARARAKGAPLA